MSMMGIERNSLERPSCDWEHLEELMSSSRRSFADAARWDTLDGRLGPSR